MTRAARKLHVSGDDFGLRSFSRLSIPPEGGRMNTLEQVIMTRQQQQQQKQNKIKQKREKVTRV